MAILHPVKFEDFVTGFTVGNPASDYFPKSSLLQRTYQSTLEKGSDEKMRLIITLSVSL